MEAMAPQQKREVTDAEVAKAMEAGVKVRCHRCGNEWDYHGSGRSDKMRKVLEGQYPVFTSCPDCRASSVRVKAPFPA